MKKKRWFTNRTWVDLETGEVLSESRVKRDNYRVLNNTHTVEDCGAYNLKKIIYECEKDKQLRIEF